MAKAAGILQLGPSSAQAARTLGGQRQRVAMGRAIVRQPLVFLFDEPLSNLDAKLRAQTRLEIQKLHAELGVTSLFVTHDQVEAMTLAQRMIVMNAGRMEQIGTPAQVYATPATTFVAGFIGSPPMNLIRGRAEGQRFVVDVALACPRPAPRAGELIPACARARSLQAGARRAGPSGRDSARCWAPSGWCTGWWATGPSPCASTPPCPRRATARRWRCRPPAGQCTGSTRRRRLCGASVEPLGPTRSGSRTAAPASWRRRTRWRPSASARRHGYRAFECDVKLSADGVPFLLHDDTLHARRRTRHRRPSPVERAVAPDAGGWHSRASPASRSEPRGHRRLVQRNGFALNIEIKPTIGLERETGAAWWRAAAARLWQPVRPVQPLLSSFRPDALATARDAQPESDPRAAARPCRTGWFEQARRSAARPRHRHIRRWTAAVVARLQAAGMRALVLYGERQRRGATPARARHRRDHHRRGGSLLARRRLDERPSTEPRSRQRFRCRARAIDARVAHARRGRAPRERVLPQHALEVNRPARPRARCAGVARVHAHLDATRASVEGDGASARTASPIRPRPSEAPRRQ